jgi:histidine ammonia-lyase
LVFKRLVNLTTNGLVVRRRQGRVSQALILTGNDLTAEAVRAVARFGRAVRLAPDAVRRMARSRAVVLAAIAENRPVYGLTTGLGARVDHRLPADALTLAEFSRLTVLGRANAVGPPLPQDAVRATLVVRANQMALGGSGADPQVAQALVALLNAGVHPEIPAIGSIGAADLCHMAHVGLTLMGEGRAELAGVALPAAEALRRAGLEPLRLGPKDGLAICSANAATAGRAALALLDGEDIRLLAQAAAALAYEGFQANTSPLDPRVQAARPAPGQREAAGELLRLLEGGTLCEPGRARRLQDPLSFRCVAQVHGALGHALRFASPALAAELNGAGDNPLVLVEDDEILSTGNFQTTALALALDTVALAMAQTGTLSAARGQRMLSERLTDLPANLTPRGPTASGFAPLTKTGQALAGEIRLLANPASIDPRAGAEGVEDDSSNAPLAVRKLADIVERMRLTLAIEMIEAAQAVELRRPARLGHGGALVYEAVRNLVAPLDEDRPFGVEVERLAAALAGGALIDELRRRCAADRALQA